MEELIVRVGVAVIIRKNINDKAHVLMGKRKGSHGAGTWSFPGGHIDFGETAREAVCRELKEETGLSDVFYLKRFAQPYGEAVFEKENKHYITLLFSGECQQSWEPELKEPNKCEEWKWISRNNVPAPLFKPVINLLSQGFDIFNE